MHNNGQEDDEEKTQHIIEAPQNAYKNIKQEKMKKYYNELVSWITSSLDQKNSPHLVQFFVCVWMCFSCILMVTIFTECQPINYNPDLYVYENADDTAMRTTNNGRKSV